MFFAFWIGLAIGILCGLWGIVIAVVCGAAGFAVGVMVTYSDGLRDGYREGIADRRLGRIGIPHKYVRHEVWKNRIPLDVSGPSGILPGDLTRSPLGRGRHGSR